DIYHIKKVAFSTRLSRITRYLQHQPTKSYHSRSKIECAQYCKISDNCKVFVISIETRECSLYNSFTVMCEGVQIVQGFQ
ncbi:Hypothetical predicted protein, partial [Mytilus galloprovincialis]